MLLSSIRLHNVRSFAGDTTVSLDDRFTVIVGRNNTGKTTLLHVVVSTMRKAKGFSNEGPIDELAREKSQSWSTALRFRVKLGTLRSFLPVTPDHPLSFSVSNDRRLLHTVPGFSRWDKADALVEVELVSANSTSHMAARLVGDGQTFFESPAPDSAICIESNGERRQLGDGGALTPLLHGVRRLIASHPVAAWSHLELPSVSLWGAHPRFPAGDSTEAVQGALTCLRLEHEVEFEGLRRSIKAAFPELGDIAFADMGPSGWLPCFRLPGATPRLVKRQHFGAGAWSTLAILTAARMAKAAGSTTFIVDEPQVHLHPGLERQLIRFLTDDALWDGSPLQVVAITHSPAFVDRALPKGQVRYIHWKDATHSSVECVSLPADTSFAAVSLSELIYADRVVFVEGPSDAAALQLLCDVLNLDYSPRIVPLLEADRFVRKPLVGQLALTARAGSLGLTLVPLVVLDADKKADNSISNAWASVAQQKRPRLVFLGHEHSDLESCFCEQHFLQEYFEAARGAAGSANGVDIEAAVQRCVRRVANASGSAKEKGATLVASLHDEILGTENQNQNKVDYLTSLMEFLVNHWSAAYALGVKERLRPLIDALAS